jgi:hypothetical protein
MARAHKIWHFLARMATFTSWTSLVSRSDLSCAPVFPERRDRINWLTGTERRTLEQFHAPCGSALKRPRVLSASELESPF